MSSRVTVVAPVPGGVGDGGAGGDDVGAHAVDLEGRADLGDLAAARRRRARPAPTSSWAAAIRSVSAALGVGVRRGEGVRVGVVRHPAAHHLDPQRRVARRGHLDGEAEPVEQLRPELALLGVHGADQHEPGGVLDRDAVALDGRAAHRGGVEQQVDEVVVQQVDLVDVQDPAVGAGEQAGLVLRLALRQRALEVQRAEHAVLGGADGQLDQADRPGLGRARPPANGPSGESGAGSRGSLENRSPATTSIGGSTAARARTIVDFAVPFSPRTRTPPTSGEIVVRIRASAMVVGADDGAEGVLLWHVGLPLALPSDIGSMRGARPVFGLLGSPP